MEYLNLISSNVPWIGRIPTDWSVTRLKDFSEFVNGYAFSSSDLQFEGDFPVIRIGDITGNKIVYSSALRCNMNKTIVSQQLIKVNDILIAMSGATVGKIGFVDDIEGNAYINQRVGIIRSLSAKYLYYVLSTDGFKNYINLMSGGSAQPNISSTMIQNFKIPKTDESTKKYIVRYLDNKCSNIDSIINDLEKQIEILEKYKKSVITEAITKGLNPNDELKDSGVNYIGKINKNYSTIKLKYLLEVKDGTHDTPEYVEPSDDTVPLITSKHIDFENKNILYDEANHISHVDYVSINKRSNVEQYDIIMPMIGTIGNPIIVFERRPFSIKNVALLKTRKNLVLSQFINYQLYSYIIEKQFEFQTRGGVQSFISLSVINNLYIIKIDEELQKEIVDYLNKKCSEIDLIKSSKKEQLEVIKKYKNSLIYEYVTGKKRVSQGDVNE